MSLLNNKFLFVHINKSGGGIVTKHMKENGNVKITGKHRNLQQMLYLAKFKHKLNINNLFIFIIIKNLWERMLSMFLFYHKNNFNSPEFFSGNNETDNDFNKWIKFIYSNKFNRKLKRGSVNIFKYCFCNQLNWISNEKGELLKVNKIIRFENNELPSFFSNIMKLKKINTNEKVHPTKHKHYSEYYNNESIKLVEKHYMKNIIYFFYKFEKKNNIK